MPKAPVPAEGDAFLREPNEAVIATVRNAWIDVDSWNGWDPVNCGPWQAGVSQPPT